MFNKNNLFLYKLIFMCAKILMRLHHLDYKIRKIHKGRRHRPIYYMKIGTKILIKILEN